MRMPAQMDVAVLEGINTLLQGIGDLLATRGNDNLSEKRGEW
jgi:hypothetical protein